MPRPTLETLTFRQPRLVFLTLMVLIAAGLSALLAIGRQEDPTITNLFATVTTNFPGASPARVETLVTSEIENSLKEIPEVDTITSVSSTGISVISIELIETLPDAALETIWSEVRDAVSDAETRFPAGVATPEVDADGISAYAAIATIRLSHDDVPLTIAGRYSEELADILRNIPGTKQVETFGVPEDEILVTVDQNRAAALGITAQAVSESIRLADAKVQAGRLRNERNDLVLEVNGEIEALDRIRDVIVRGGQDTTATRLSDIATVERQAKSPGSEFAYHNGRPAILIASTLEDGLQVDVWAGFVREEIDAFQTALPGGLELDLIFDQSGYTVDRLAEVGTNMLIGISLVVGVLLITLGVRAAFIVALILPVVTLATLATMNFIGLAIHQMSVTGLIVALGLLVDAGIVMTDEVGQRVRQGVNRLEAVRDAVRRLGGPLFASTVTTALSFMPMILLPGPAGDFVGSIALAVVIMLVWSFLLAMTITPAIAGWIMPAQGKTNFFNSGVPGGPVAWLFKACLSWAVRNPIRSIALALIVPVIGFASMSTLTAQFFPGVDRDQFFIEFDMPPGTGINETKRLAERADSYLSGIEGVEQIYWSVGRSGPAFYYNVPSGRENASGYAQAFLTTSSSTVTEELISDLERSLGELEPSAQVRVRGLVQGPPVAAPVELRIVGPEPETLREIGDQLMLKLAEVDTITSVRTTLGSGAPKIVVDVDEAKARALGLDLTAVAAQLRAALEGVTGGSLVEGTEQLPVRVRLGDSVRSDLSAVRDILIASPQSASLTQSGGFAALPLSAIAEISILPSDSSITRRNGERVNTVQGFTLRSVLPEEALAAVQTRLDEDNFQLPVGYRLELGGDSDARSNTLGNLLASVGIIVTLTIATIVMTFNSFRLTGVALVVCVLSAGLSIFSLAVLQYPFGINAILGVIGSIGVSINAAIIIMTGLQNNEDAKHGDPDAMVDVVMGSSRHIVSTTITTFGGFLPLILAGGGFWPPFAVAIAGGVLLSTIVSFFFTPPAFALVYARRRRRQKTSARKTANSSVVEQPENQFADAPEPALPIAAE
ncbi:MAG: efflux RND transporter permease subunit [Pseudomonadota bacterium]